MRFFVFYENRLVVLKEMPEQLRNYGSHFSAEDKDKIQMPKIWWNANICSSHSLISLEKISLLNYKEAYEGKEEDE